MFTSASLIESLRQHHMLDTTQLEEAKQLAAGIPEARQIANELTRRGWLTAFQVRMLAQGRGPQLVIGPYVILEKLGEGGMGAVFKARNTRLGRIVAIKLLRKERSTNSEVIRRFQREVQVASSLSHPNVVRAIDASEVNGNLIFEMEYVEGINLTQLVGKRGALPVPMACDFIRQTALGLQHAHEKGLVHRDIKPSNLVVTRALSTASGVESSPHGLIKLLDLGLALIQTPEGGQEKTRLTKLGKVVGTTDFLAPEQARNSHGVDIRADLYALGCTFYFLLTGQVPFPAGAPMEKLLKHQLDEPEALETLRPELPPDLIAIVRKLMAKKAENRYQAPNEVAVLLEPFVRTSAKTTPMGLPTLPTPLRTAPLSPAPVAAKPRSTPVIPVQPDRVASSAPMLPAASAVATAVLEPPPLPASAVETATKLATLPEARALPHAALAATHSDPFLRMSSVAPDQPRPRNRTLFFALIALTTLCGLAIAAFFGWHHDDSIASEKEADRSVEKIPAPKGTEPWSFDRFAAADIPVAECTTGQPKELVAVLGEHRQRHWGAVTGIACSPDGKFIVSAGDDGFLRVWNAQNGREAGFFVEDVGRVITLAFVDNKTLLSVNQVAYRDGPVIQAMRWNLGTMKCGKITTLLKGARPLTAAALTPDGEVVALAWRKPAGDTVAGEMALINLMDSEEEPALLAQKEPVSLLAWSEDGRTLAGALGKQIKLWNLAGKEIRSWPGHDSIVTGLAFLRGSTALVSSCALAKGLSTDGEIKVWDLPSGKLRNTAPVPGSVLALTRDDQGQKLAWGSVKGGAYTLTVWNVADDKDRYTLGPLGSRPVALAFAKDGTLVSASDDQSLHLWDLVTRKERLPLSSTRGRILTPLLSPDGQTLAFLSSAIERGAVLLDLATGKEKVLTHLKGRFGQTLGFVADGQTLGCWGPGGAAFWQTATGREMPAFRAPANSHLVGALAPDGRCVVVVGKDGSVKLWDPLMDKVKFTLKEQANHGIGTAAFSPDGKRLAIGGLGLPGVRLYDPATGEGQGTQRTIGTQTASLKFSADSRLLAAIGRDGTIRVWDVVTDKELCKTPGHAGANQLAFTGNGAYLAVWGPRSLSVVDIAGAKEQSVVTGPDGFVTAIAVAPVGQSLAFATSEGWLYLLNAATPAREKMRKIELPGPITALLFAGAGRHLVTANANGTLYVLRVEAARK